MGDPTSIYSVPLDASAPAKRLDASATSADGGLALSPDGARLAYLARKGSIFTATRARVMLRDLKTGATREPYQIAKIVCPVLTISARDDRFGTASRAKSIAVRVPDGKAMVMPWSATPPTPCARSRIPANRVI